MSHIELLPDHSVRVHCRLTSSREINSSVTREGTQIWIERFEASIARGLRNANAVFANRVVLLPGDGNLRYDFQGLESEPADVRLERVSYLSLCEDHPIKA